MTGYSMRDEVRSTKHFEEAMDIAKNFFIVEGQEKAARVCLGPDSDYWKKLDEFIQGFLKKRL